MFSSKTCPFSVSTNVDYSNCSSLAVILMTHGALDEGTEVFHTHDGCIPISVLWKSFTGDKCTGLTGKPKLFFIQVCGLICQSKICVCNVTGY